MRVFKCPVLAALKQVWPLPMSPTDRALAAQGHGTAQLRGTGKMFLLIYQKNMSQFSPGSDMEILEHLCKYPRACPHCSCLAAQLPLPSGILSANRLILFHFHFICSFSHAVRVTESCRVSVSLLWTPGRGDPNRAFPEPRL